MYDWHKNMSKLRVLLAEDHETVREGLRLIIDSQPDMEIVGEAANGYEVLSRVPELNPQIIVMDISMPGMNGLKATRRVKEAHPDIGIVALTRHKESGYVQEVLQAGASAYVLKQSASDELLRAIRAVAVGKSYLDPEITGNVISGRQTKHVDRPSTALSDREREVLQLIALGYSNKEIASRLEVSVKTVEAHKANSMKKLGLSSRIEIVNFALLQGWLETN
jgi:DNA-binding NarL/FixJ family response regulator